MQCQIKQWSEEKQKWGSCQHPAEYELRPAVEDPALKQYFTLAYGKKPRAKKLCAEHVRVFTAVADEKKNRAGGGGNTCIEQKTFENVSESEKWWMRAKPQSVPSGSKLNPYHIWTFVSFVHRAAKIGKEAPTTTNALVKNGQLELLKKAQEAVVSALWDHNLSPILKNPKKDGEPKKETTDRFDKMVRVYGKNMNAMVTVVLDCMIDPKFHADCKRVIPSGMTTENQVKTLFKSTPITEMQEKLMPFAKSLCPTSSNWFGLKQNPRCPMHGAMVVSYVVAAAMVWAHTKEPTPDCPTDEQLKPLAQLVSCWMADLAFWDETKACSFVYTI